MCQNKTPLGEIIDFSDKEDGIQVEIAMEWCNADYNENILSYANDVADRRWRHPRSRLSRAL
jgi:DNA gyrase/topoisomerase IV subunit B